MRNGFIPRIRWGARRGLAAAAATLPIVAAALLAASLFAGGCAKKKSAGSAPGAASPAAGSRSAPAEVTIGVSLLTRTHPFYQDLEAGLTRAAEANGYHLVVTAGEFDVAKQKDQLQDFIVRRVNAMSEREIHCSAAAL